MNDPKVIQPMRSILFITFYLTALFSVPTVAASKFSLLTEENLPFNYTDPRSGKIIGIGTEVVEQIFKRAKLQYSITLLPWVRAYNGALKEANTCVFMTAKTEEREPQFKWVGPFLEVEWIVYGRSGATHQISSIEDLKKLRLGGYIGDGPTVFLQGKGLELDLVSDDTLNLKKLQAGRIDAWVSNNVRGPLLAKKQGIPDLRKLLTLKVIAHYVACHKQTDDSVIKTLNQELKNLKSTGQIEKLVSKYSKLLSI